MDNKKKLLKAISSLEMLKTDKEKFVDTIMDIANNSSGNNNSNTILSYYYYKFNDSLVSYLGDLVGNYIEYMKLEVIIKSYNFDNDIILHGMYDNNNSGPGGESLAVAIPKYIRQYNGLIDFYIVLKSYCEYIEEDYNEIYNIFKGNEISEEEFNKDISILTADKFE